MFQADSDMHDYTLVTLPGSFGSSVAVSVDLLRTAALQAPRAGAPVPRWRLCSPAGGTVRLASGWSIDTTRLPGPRSADRSTWILPGLGLDTRADVDAALADPGFALLAAHTAAHVARGGRVAACCSAVFVLQAAGLLAGRSATTTWWLAPHLQRLAPDCRVDAARMVCSDGPVTTGAAAFAQLDLVLHLLRRDFGPALVERLSRFLLLDAREAQSPYMLPEVMAAGNRLVADIVALVDAGLPEVPSVAALAQRFCVSERTLARRVQHATGHSTIALIQTVRLRRARRLLEESRLSVEQVAAAVGYEDATALRRLMRKAQGATPRQFRPRATAPA